MVREGESGKRRRVESGRGQDSLEPVLWMDREGSAEVSQFSLGLPTCVLIECVDVKACWILRTEP